MGLTEKTQESEAHLVAPLPVDELSLWSGGVLLNDTKNLLFLHIFMIKDKWQGKNMRTKRNNEPPVDKILSPDCTMVS